MPPLKTIPRHVRFRKSQNHLPPTKTNPLWAHDRRRKRKGASRKEKVRARMGQINPYWKHHKLSEIKTGKESGWKYYRLGQYYSDGVYTPKNISLASNAFKKAVSLGIKKAYNNLGVLHFNTRPKTAIYWLKKGDDAGIKDARFNLALNYYEGSGVEKNFEKAFNLFKSVGDSDSLYMIGEMYYYGEHVEKDYTKAIQYYKRAYKMGDVDAASKLGYIYMMGKGVPIDEEKAVEYYQKGVDGGNSSRKLNELLERNCVYSRQPPCKKKFIMKNGCCYKTKKTFLERTSRTMVKQWPLQWPLLSMEQIANRDFKKQLSFAFEVFQIGIADSRVRREANDAIFNGAVQLMPDIKYDRGHVYRYTTLDYYFRHLEEGKEFLLIPVTIIQPKFVHRNVVLLQKSTKKAWWIEPHWKDRKPIRVFKIFQEMKNRVKGLVPYRMRLLSHIIPDVYYQNNDCMCTLWAPMAASFLIHFKLDTAKTRRFMRRIPIPMQAVYSLADYIYKRCAIRDTGELRKKIHIENVFARIAPTRYEELPKSSYPQDSKFVEPLIQTFYRESEC